MGCRMADRRENPSVNPNWKDGSCVTNKGSQAAYRKRYPERIKARRQVGKAIREGRLNRLPCATCGNIKSEAHHEDYDKPLEVDWLCKKCHAGIHYPKPIPS